VRAQLLTAAALLPLTTQSGVDLSNVKMSMNPFCEIAVEVQTGDARGG
jgi:electron transfer flavoprotein alpha/beta subunit